MLTEGVGAMEQHFFIPDKHHVILHSRPMRTDPTADNSGLAAKMTLPPLPYEE